MFVKKVVCEQCFFSDLFDNKKMGIDGIMSCFSAIRPAGAGRGSVAQV